MRGLIQGVERYGCVVVGQLLGGNVKPIRPAHERHRQPVPFHIAGLRPQTEGVAVLERQIVDRATHHAIPTLHRVLNGRQSLPLRKPGQQAHSLNRVALA